MTSNRIPHWAALAITTAAAGLSPGGAHAYKAYATAAVAQVNFEPGVVDYGQQLTAAAQATATLPNIFEQTATSADLAQGQVHVRRSSVPLAPLALCNPSVKPLSPTVSRTCPL